MKLEKKHKDATRYLVEHLEKVLTSARSLHWGVETGSLEHANKCLNEMAKRYEDVKKSLEEVDSLFTEPA